MPKVEPIINIMVDGININATHFAKFATVDEAVAAFESDGILKAHNKSKDWAEAIYVRCRETVTPSETKDVKVTKKK